MEFNLILGDPAAYYWFIVTPFGLLLGIYSWDAGMDILVP
jgi:hypothetical protein